ncbi:MAG: HAD family hydrolase [bacterium]|jgi:histidinol-phosphate phosphatase family protein|nr:HAD family hydrolase [bacterium]
MTPRHQAVFFDRDGTLIRDTGYPRDPKTVEILPGVVPFLRTLQERGYLLVVISNQSGIGRGMITPAQARAVHDRFIQVFAEQGIAIHGTYYCPHGPEEDCACRKPAPAMLLQAAESLGIDMARSFMVGDKPSDVEAGQNAGCRGIWFQPAGAGWKSPMRPDLITADWDEILTYITQNVT